MTTTALKTDWRHDGEALQRDFERDGYVAIKGFCSPKEIAEILENIARMKRDVIPGMPEEHVFCEEKGNLDTLKQLQKLQEHDAFCRELYDGKFRQLAQLLLQNDVSSQNMQYFNKPPQIGQPTPPHQDGYYFKITPSKAVTMWLALEDVDPDTGCVRYVRGSHQYGMRHHARSAVLGFSQHILDFGIPFDRKNEVAFPAQPGDLLVHHSLTVHWADGNTSADRTRQAMGFIYYAAGVEEDKAAHAAYQQQLKAEMAAVGQI